MLEYRAFTLAKRKMTVFYILHYLEIRLENNVKREYTTVSHEFEWKTMYWDKIVLRRIHSVAVAA